MKSCSKVNLEFSSRNNSCRACCFKPNLSKRNKAYWIFNITELWNLISNDKKKKAERF